MTTKLLTDETIKKHIKKYGKEEYIKQLEARLKKGEEDYKRGKQQILGIFKITIFKYWIKTF